MIFIIKKINMFIPRNANWSYLALFSYVDDAILRHPHMNFQLSTILSAFEIE